MLNDSGRTSSDLPIFVMFTALYCLLMPCLVLPWYSGHNSSFLFTSSTFRQHSLPASCLAIQLSQSLSPVNHACVSVTICTMTESRRLLQTLKPPAGLSRREHKAWPSIDIFSCHRPSPQLLNTTLRRHSSSSPLFATLLRQSSLPYDQHGILQAYPETSQGRKV